MTLKVEKIFLSADIKKARRKAVKQKEAENTDVIVRMADGCYYVASFFSFSSLEQQIASDKEKEKDQFLKGKYFWIKDKTVLIEKCTKENIESVVFHLIEQGNFSLAFQNISQ